MKYKPVAYPVSIVHVNEISTPHLLARVVRERYGFGKWVICFYDRLKKNKHYREYFPCIGETCKHWEGCKMKMRKLANPKKYKSCKANSKIRPNWSSRAWIEISERKIMDSSETDFSFDLINNKNKMKMMWFFSENEKKAFQKEEKANKEDMYY